MGLNNVAYKNIATRKKASRNEEVTWIFQKKWQVISISSQQLVKYLAFYL